MFTNNETQLPVGTYTFNQTKSAFTFDIGEFYMNYDFSKSTGTIANVKSGTVKIEKSGSTYTITIDCVATDDSKINGFNKVIIALDTSTK